jgi:hypothetical protein
VGAITTLFELGNKIVPGLVDRAIGRLGYEGQETDSPEARRLRDPTLFAASARASGNRGPFDDEAKGVPALDWAFRVPGMLVVGAALAAVLVLLWQSSGLGSG